MDAMKFQLGLIEREAPSALFEPLLQASEKDVSHRELMLVWECVMRVLAVCAWRVVTANGWRSSELVDAESADLSAPGLGKWYRVLLASIKLIEKHHDHAAGLGPLARALDSAAQEPGLEALFQAFEALRCVDFSPPAGRDRLDLLDAVVRYRNWMEHRSGKERGDVDEPLRGPLAAALVDFTLAVPLTGKARVVLVVGQRLEADSCFLDCLSQHGAWPTERTLSVKREVYDRVRVGEVYLLDPSGALTRMAPLVVAHKQRGEWLVGWLSNIQRSTIIAATGRRRVQPTITVPATPSDIEWLRGLKGDRKSSPAASVEDDPWPGMRSYTERDARRFHGRDKERCSALEILDSQRCLILCGVSGAGKSSLLRAGIMPELWPSASEPTDDPHRSGSRPSCVLEFAPGLDPMSSLRKTMLEVAPTDSSLRAKWIELVHSGLSDVPADQTSDERRNLLTTLLSLAAMDRDLVVVVDQLEQLWQEAPAADRSSGPASARVRQWVLALLTRAADRAHEGRYRVVVTIRADMLDRPFGDAEFCKLYKRCHFLLGPMDRAGLTTAIRAPLAMVGKEATAEFVDVAVTDAMQCGGNLTLLGVLLAEVWRRGQRFDLDAYHNIGGLGGVIDRLAEEARAEGARDDDASESPAHNALVRLFLLLVSVTSDGRFIRRSIALRHAAERVGLSEAVLRERLGPYVRRGLVLLRARDERGDGAAAQVVDVEVAHESLFSEWTWLHERLQRREEMIRLRDEVEQAAHEFERRGMKGVWHDDDPRLAQAWAAERKGELDLSSRGSEFLALSRRRARRERLLAAGAAVVLAVFAVAAGVGGWRAHRAHGRADRARRHAEEMVDLAMFAAHDRLAPIGRFDDRDAIFERIDAYYRTADRDDDFDHEGGRRSGTRYLRPGADEAAALRELRAGLATIERRSQREPNDLDLQRDLALCRRWIGDVLRQQGGNAVRALSEYRASAQILERLAATDGGRVEFLTDLIVVQHRMALALREVGAPREAAALLHRALATLQRVDAEGRLTVQQKTWIPEIVAQAAALPPVAAAASALPTPPAVPHAATEGDLGKSPMGAPGEAPTETPVIEAPAPRRRPTPDGARSRSTPRRSPPR